MAERAPTPAEICGYAGHEWADAGGGHAICLVCEAERSYDPQPSFTRMGAPSPVQEARA